MLFCTAFLLDCLLCIVSQHSAELDSLHCLLNLRIAFCFIPCCAEVHCTCTSFSRLLFNQHMPNSVLKVRSSQIFQFRLNSFLGTVNEIRIPDDVMTTNTDQRVQGKKVFTKPVVLNGNMTTVNATINGLNIPDDLVLRNTRQRVTGQKNFSKAVIVEESIIVVGKTNGLDLSEFSKRVVTLSSNQTITRKKTFLKGFAVGQNLDVTGLVDGVNLTELDSDAVRINQSEVIKGNQRSVKLSCVVDIVMSRSQSPVDLRLPNALNIFLWLTQTRLSQGQRHELRFELNNIITRSLTHSHPFQVSLPTSRTLSHKSSFIPRTCNLWNLLPSSCFPESYNLPFSKSKINKLDRISLSSYRFAFFFLPSLRLCIGHHGLSPT